ncbi:Rv3235 family protein [Nocardioides sp. CER19]|uniref:Rv3235 family protein n=1 Tax=Nocardioides sp. CER19 TaxID=3038538 RepID=UPI00244C6176|nr:Rv3235 family protein [Nocardioides sp. CER19]MDH2415136.1 Rv3235 family protein [Nocardioides sp. CER19]
MTEPSRTSLVPLAPSAPVASVQGTLALALQPRQEPPTVRAARPGGGADVVRIDRRARREAEAWSCRFAQAAVEIVGGDRPATQLLRWSSPEVYADLNRRAQLVARAGGHQPGQARVQPVRPRVVGVRTCFVDAGIVEAGLHLRYGQRSRAVAARFERRDGRWVCTALEFA